MNEKPNESINQNQEQIEHSNQKNLKPNNAKLSNTEIKNKKEQKEPKFKNFISGAKGLSLGISIVAAIGIGIGIGILLKNLLNVFWVFWIGIFWGVSAAILNVYKAYKSQLKDFEKLENTPKYKYKKE